MKLKINKDSVQFRYNYDSFGNALGNAAVAAIRDYKSEPSLQDKLNKSFKKISDKVSAQTDAHAGSLIRKSAADVAANVEANGIKNIKPIDAALAAENDMVLAENQARHNSNVEKANARNAQLATDAAALGARHQATIDRVAANGQAAFDAGVIRGEHRANTLRTVSDQERSYQQFERQADSYIDFREGQRADFENWYNELSPVQQGLFDTGVKFSQWVWDTEVSIGHSIADTAKTGIQVGSYISDDADIRWSVSVSNKKRRLEPEYKVYGGSDYALGFSGKSGTFGLQSDKLNDFDPTNSKTPQVLKSRLKANTSIHARLENITDVFDGNAWEIGVPILEADPVGDLPLFTGIKPTKWSPIDVKAAPGIRTNLLENSTRASLNVKFSVGGWVFNNWNINVGLEFRK